MSITGMVSALAESFRSSPGLLAVLLVSFCWAGMTYLAVQNRDIRAHEEKIAILERCFPPHDRTDIPADAYPADLRPGTGDTGDFELPDGPAFLLPSLHRPPKVQQSGHATPLPATIWRAP